MPLAHRDFAFLFAAQPLPAIAMGADGCILAVSEALLTLTGTTAAELEEHDIAAVPALSSLGAAWEAGAREALRTYPEPPPATTPVYFRPAPTYQAEHLPWWQLMFRVAPDATYVLCTARPVLAEPAASPLVSPLAPRLAQLQFLLDQLPGYLAALSGPTHVYAYASPSLHQLLGGRACVGLPLVEVLTKSTSDRLIHHLNRVYRTGESAALTAFPIFSASNEASAHMRYFDLYFGPIHEVEATPVGVLFYANEVTERVVARRRAEELDAAVRHRDSQVRMMTEALPLITFINDSQGQASYMSPQWHAFTGQSETEALGLGYLSAIHPDDVIGTMEAVREAAAANEGWEREIRFRHHNGHYRWHHTRVVPILDENGKLLQWYGTSTDVHAAKLLDKQLRVKDEQLQEILSQVPAYIATLAGPELRYDFVNEPMQALLGGSTPAGQTVAGDLSGVADDLLAVLREVYRSGRPFVAKAYRLMRPDAATDEGTPRYFDFALQPLFDEHGAVRGLLVFAVDVTLQELSRQRTETLAEETRRQDARLRVLTETAPQITLTIDSEGKIEYISPQWYQFTGQPPHADVDMMWPLLIHPDDRLRVIAEQTAARATGASWSYEYRLRRCDGHHRWMLSRGVPELDVTGRAVRWHGAITDVHDQRELSETLRRGEAELRFLAESIPQMIWTATANGFIDYYNQRTAEYTGLKLEEMGPTGWITLLDPSEQAAASRRWLHCVRTGQSYDGTFRLRRHDGQYRWHLIRVRQRADVRGLRWFGSCTDVDDQLRLQQVLQGQYDELARTNADLDNFVYTASHDLHQPLYNIVGLFDELRRSATFHDPEQEQILVMVDKALTQLNTTLRDLADTVQEQRNPPTAAPVQLQHIADEVLLGLQSQINAAQARVATNFDAAPVIDYGRASLRSIIHNLVSNALKYAHPERKPVISITSTLADNDQPMLIVQDNGLGMDVHAGPQSVFQLFERQHSHVAGSGVGLYLVQRIVRSHGGHIDVSSVMGEGTTFTIHWFA